MKTLLKLVFVTLLVSTFSACAATPRQLNTMPEAELSEVPDQRLEDLLCMHALELPEDQRIVDEIVKRKIYSREAVESILKKQIHLGMTKREVRCSWGPSTYDHKYVSDYSYRETKAYGGRVFGVPNQYVHFTDGRVTSWSSY